MPEYPDICVYQDALTRFIGGREIREITVRSPFVLRTVDPPIEKCTGLLVRRISTIGKRIVFEVDGAYFIVFHLMIAGRFHWKDQSCPLPAKSDLATFQFDHGTLLMTEAGSKKRASIHIVRGRPALKQFDRGGLDVLHTNLSAFAQRLRQENHTLKWALTDPTILSGIGNAYSDEILHAAGLSPLLWTTRLTDEQMMHLYQTIRTLLPIWRDRLMKQTGQGFPEKVTAFRPDMAVHGKFGQPCPTCGAPVQRIVHAASEINYCPGCQTGGRVLKDRSLSRLLRDDWPESPAELEE